MKKYLLFFLLAFVIISLNRTFAQQVNQKTFYSSKYQLNSASQQIPQEDGYILSKENRNNNRAFTTLLTQDFSSTTFPPTGWTRGHATGTTMDWIRGIGPQTYSTFSNVYTTADNGYAFVNSDGLGSDGVSEDCWLKTPSINCYGLTSVWLRFDEFFRRFNTTPAPTGDVEVSNNGSTWTIVHQAHSGIAAGGATSNPKFVDVDISAIAANQSSVYVRFRWTGSYDYYWFIDDVEVYSRLQYDASFSARANANEYTSVPLVHYTNTTMPLSATAWNAGGSTINNIYMGVKVYDGLGTAVYSANSNTVSSLTANATGTLTATGYTPPAGKDVYFPEFIVHMQQADGDIHNDTINQAFWINDSVYSRDDAIFTGTLDGSLGTSSMSSIFGQNYQVLTNDKLKHVACYVTGGVVGDTTQILIYNTTNNLPTTLLASSAIYKFTTAGSQWVDLPISGGPLSLSPGTYFIGIKQFSKTHNIGVAYTENNFTNLKVYAKIGTDPWDTLSVIGYKVSFIIRPYMVCGTYKPVISAPQSFLCTGDQLTLTSTPGSNYLWNPGSQNTRTKVISAGGSYTVSVTSVDGCTGVSDPIVISEYAKPVINLGNDTAVCNGINLNAGSGFQSYSWTGGTSSNQYLWAGSSGQYSCTVTNSHGCSKNDIINLTVYPNPIVNLGHDTSVCNNYTLNAGAGYSNYIWAGGTSSTQNLTVNSSGSYSVTVTDAHNCKGSDAAIITIYQNPVVNLGHDTSVCAQYTLNAGSGFSNYTWAGGTSTTQNLLVTNTGNYSVTVTDAHNCKGNDAAYITIKPNPIVNLGHDTIICGNDIITLNAGNPGASSYNWWNGSGGQFHNVDVSYCSPGNTCNYSVTVTNNGCSGTDAIALTFNSYPTVTLGPDQTVCANQTVNLDAGGPYSSYSWSTGANVQQIQVDSTGTGIGIKTVIVNVINNSCRKSDTIKINFDPCTGMSEETQNFFNVYPNPSHDKVYISFTDNFEGEIEIISASGQKVYESNKFINPSELLLIDISSFTKGLYFILIKGDSIKPVKLIVD